MDELEIFKNRISSLINKAYNGNVCLLNFLDDAHLSIVKQFEKNLSGINIYYNGGIKNSDTMRVIISPYEVNDEDFKICIFKVIYNKKFYDINHRSVLGSLMGLGIKRECIGDIVIKDDVYFAVTKEISSYVKENLNYIGKASIELEEVNYDIYNEINYDIKLDFVSSLRIDAIIAAAFNVSRNEAHEAILEGLIYINHVLTLNPSENVKLLDEISYRGKGRSKLMEVGGLSKSGRIAVKLGRRI